MHETDYRQLLNELFQTAVAAADPSKCLFPHLPDAPRGKTVVVGAGKASAAMARALEDTWQGPISGVVVTRYGHAVPCENIKIIEAGHPVADENGIRAARSILKAVTGLGKDDLVISLISGGGSALLSLPAEGLQLNDLQRIGAALLSSGATISEMNCVRKHLSGIKGGRLALAAAPARMVTLLISDVPGDDPAIIASGPTVPDDTTSRQALGILQRYGIEVTPLIASVLSGPAGQTPPATHPCFANNEVRMIATPLRSLQAAAAVARARGFEPLILGDAIEGEAREVGIVHAGIAKCVAQHGYPLQAPAVILSGGETTVTVRAKGRGGRNTEFLLSLAIALGGQAATHAIACDTDGVDGSEDNAGAWIGPRTLARAQQLGMSPQEYLLSNDAYSFFSAMNDLIVSGPTLTNVNDFRAVLVSNVASAEHGHF